MSNKVPKDSKVIAFLDNHPRAIMVMHAARRRARELGCSWSVAYIQTPSHFHKAASDVMEHVLRLCTLAEQMGAEVLNLHADSIEKGLSVLFEKEGERIALFVISSSGGSRSFFKMPMRRAIWEQAARIASEHTRIEIVPLSGTTTNWSQWRSFSFQRVNPLHIVYAFLAVGVAYGVVNILEWILQPALFRVNIQNITLLFMAACAFVASRYGLFAGLTAAGSSFVIYNYFYVPPYNEFRLSSVTEWLSMAIFLFAGLMIALFTSRVRNYAENVVRRERGTQALYTLYRLASTTFSRQQLLETLQVKLSQMLDIEVAFFLPPMLNPDNVEAYMPASLTLEEVDKKALDTCWQEIKTTGFATPVHPKASWRFEPMVAPRGEIGVLAVRPKNGKKLDIWLGGLITNIADQTAVLMEHIELGRSMEDTRIREEREKLRSMLLSSVSHDLKTPLAGIIGSLSVYRSVGSRLEESRKEELLEGALEEAQRLDSFITNILDMTRLESGKIDFRPEWNDISNVITTVTKRIQHRLRNHELKIINASPGVEVFMDVMMIEQVLQNLLDNACKYTAVGTRIEIYCNADKLKGFVCEVRDYGNGIPHDRLANVFDKYARLQKEDSQVAGTGLGLAICKAIMEAQGGFIVADKHPMGGAIFRFGLPKWRNKKNTKKIEEVA